MAKTRASRSARTSGSARASDSATVASSQMENGEAAKVTYPNCKTKTRTKKKVTSSSKTKGQKSKPSMGGKSLIEKTLKKVFSCPVCLTLPLCNIYQCKEGHIVCMDCYNKLKSPILCPTCRTEMPQAPIRNRGAEQVLLYTILSTLPYKSNCFIFRP